MSETTDANENDRSLDVNVLLREYDTLRAEILARVKSRFDMLIFTAPAATFIASQGQLSRNWRFAVVVGAAAFLLSLWFYFGSAINQCSVRIAEVEGMINELVGSPLLQWESRQRNATTHTGRDAG